MLCKFPLTVIHVSRLSLDAPEMRNVHTLLFYLVPCFGTCTLKHTVMEINPL